MRYIEPDLTNLSLMDPIEMRKQTRKTTYCKNPNTISLTWLRRALLFLSYQTLVYWESEINRRFQ